MFIMTSFVTTVLHGTKGNPLLQIIVTFSIYTLVLEYFQNPVISFYIYFDFTILPFEGGVNVHTVFPQINQQCP